MKKKGKIILCKEYEVKELLKILWDKKLFIFLLGIMIGMIALPFSEVSYEKALNNYNRLISDKNTSSSKYSNEIFIEVKTKSNNEVLFLDIVKIIKKIMYDNNYLLEIDTLPSNNIIILKEISDGKNTLKLETNLIINETTILLTELFLKEEISLEILKEISIKHENKKDINNILLKKPTEKQNKIKVVSTAFLYGVLFASCFVLVRDFFREQQYGC